jgi:hypothetical protein
MMSLAEHAHQHPFRHAVGLCLFAALFAANRRVKSSGIFILALWNLTGVMLHEAAHLAAGILFRARPTAVSLIPRRDGNRWQLGSVRFARITAVNALPIALAPLALAGIAWLTAMNWFHWAPPTLASTLGLYATLFVLLYNALPSRQDLRVAANWQCLLLYLPILIIAVICLYRSH